MKFRANKDFGQHFLTDQNIIKKICENFTEECDAIFEIGPGPGVLTEHLVKLKKPFFAIEIDERFIQHLESMDTNLKVINKDVLKVDLQQILQEQFQGCSKILCVSNLPYNISAPIISRLVKINSISYLTLMMQKEVAEKILPPENARNSMNSLLCLTQSFFSVNKLVHVPPGAFSPPPKVQSSVLSFARKQMVEATEKEIFTSKDEFEGFLRKIFAERRKQLGTVLKKHYDKERIQQEFSRLSLDTRQRSETLSLQDVQSLFINLNSK